MSLLAYLLERARRLTPTLKAACDSLYGGRVTRCLAVLSPAQYLVYVRCTLSLNIRLTKTQGRYDMTPAEFLAGQKDQREVFAWILRLVPPDSPGSPLDRLPPEIVWPPTPRGKDPENALELYPTAIEKLDWAKDCYVRMVKNLPAEESVKLKISESLAVGAIHDSEYNGFVHRCENGFAICIPTGALMLISFAAELYCLNASLGFQTAVITSDYSFYGWQDHRLYRAARTIKYRQRKDELAPYYPERVAGELEFLFKNYADLGVVGTPDLFKPFGVLPQFPSPTRFGHPLEAGNHLREHAIRFLLMHECGHILKNHFDGAPSHDQEFEADWAAFELGVRSAKSRQAVVASLLGAWLVLTIAKRVEAYNNGPIGFTHPPAQERLDKLIKFARGTDLMGCLTRQHVLHRLREIDQRDALLRKTSEGYRQWAKKNNSIANVISDCLRAKSDVVFMDQLPRWLLQSPPNRLFSTLAAARVEFERMKKRNPADADADYALKMIMKIYDAAGDNAASTLSTRLQNAYLAEVRRAS
jgi:hypothetical protein